MEEIVNEVLVGRNDTIIRTEKRPGWFLKLFGCKPKQVEYRGDCTVWYQTKPLFVRCPAHVEKWLVGIWQEAKWLQQDQNDRLKRKDKNHMP